MGCSCGEVERARSSHRCNGAVACIAARVYSTNALLSLNHDAQAHCPPPGLEDNELRVVWRALGLPGHTLDGVGTWNLPMVAEGISAAPSACLGRVAVSAVSCWATDVARLRAVVDRFGSLAEFADGGSRLVAFSAQRSIPEKGKQVCCPKRIMMSGSVRQQDRLLLARFVGGRTVPADGHRPPSPASCGLGVACDGHTYDCGVQRTPLRRELQGR